ncbi:cation-translocating P-type ATPase [Carnobacterium maltaromaticum]|uniref:histidine kinase n=1 Tax=Carnobacterium maltaromaticum TaxID=2751 RepID=UPI001071D69F|nr:histidine kinase [Carnobacterium maltaromaticum]
MIINLVIRLMSLVAYIFLLNYFFSGWSLERKYFAKSNFLILVIICLYMGSLYLFNFTSFPFLNILMSIVFILIIAKQYNLNKKEIFFWIPILLATNFICELISLTLFKILFSSNSYDLNSPLFIIITTVFTMVVDVSILFSIKHLFLKKNTLYQPIDLVPLVALSSIPIVSVIILLSFLLSEIQTNVNSIALGLSVSFGILYINLCILYLYNNLIKRLRKANHISLQKKALESEVKYIGEIKKNQLNISYIKHDLKNQYLVLLGLLNREHTNEAKNYILNSMNQLDHHSNFYTSDSVLNYLLNEKNSIAKK